MRKMLALTGLFVSCCPAAWALDAERCQTVRMSDLGWTDIALTNASAEIVLEALGYDVEQTLLGLDITYQSLKDSQMDVFQGNWRPVQDVQYKSYFDEGSVKVLGVNLEGAKYTLVVPKYVSDAGVTSFDDLAAHADAFEGRIYAIEPGSNQPLLDMVDAGRHGLEDWDIVESSEAAMLAQVERAIEREEWIVFLGWQPHPMNIDYEITYLAGGDVEFGPYFGGATVRTIARPDFAADCPNAARFFSKLVFDVEYENRGMQMITGEGRTPEEAATTMIAENPDRLAAWLAEVTTLGGEPGLPAVKKALGL